jgi:CheY-like chemotaxis protein
LKVFIFRAVQEILFNTVKHSGVKNARIIVSYTDSDMCITVSDQGRGFDPGSIHLGTPQAGFGLLSLRERASYIGCGLTIDSAPGNGSRFTLMIPLALITEAPAYRAAAACRIGEGAPSVTPPDKRAARVLFVDDHKVMRQGLIRLIEGQPDIQVVGEAADGRQAIEQVRRLHPDVVVMDVSMPEMDGVEATRRIKSEFPDVRIIGLSMIEEEHVAEAMHDAGAEAFVSKTASSSILLKAIYGKPENG